MPATAPRRRSSGSKGGDSTALFAMLGLAAAGGAYFLLKPKTAGAAELPAGQGSLSTTTPSGGGASTSRPTNELSEELKQQMAEALGRLGVSPATGKLSGAADAEAIRFASQLVGTLEAMGFKEAASALRKYVDEAAKSVKTPAEAAPIAAAAPAGLTAEQREYIARVMSLEREPNKIGLLIDWLKKLSPSAERDTMIQMAQALALQLAAAQSTAATMSQIDQVIKSTVPAQIQAAAAQPPPALPNIPLTPPPAPVYTPPKVTTSPGLPIPGQTPHLPETPVAIPPKPVPQAVPVPSTPIELAAKAMIANLLAMQKQYGVLAAKGREDKNLVKKFQSLAGVTADALAGPATLILAAGKGAVELPLVYYWPKTATATTVKQYRDGLEKVAAKFIEMGRAAEAQTLRASISRENGQSGITGAAPAPAPKPVAAAAPKPSAAPVATSTAIEDPSPGARVLKVTSPMMKGPDVTNWQMKLQLGDKNGVKYLPAGQKSTDGIYGNVCAAATKLFQKNAGIAQDGAVGPNTRKAAVAMGMW